MPRIFALILGLIFVEYVSAQQIYDQQTGKLTTVDDVSFVCVGVDPNWNLTISKGLITLYIEKERNMFVRTITPVKPIGDRSGKVHAYSAMTRENKSVMILLRKTDTGCYNDASGLKHQYDVYAVFPDKVVVGCCDSRN